MLIFLFLFYDRPVAQEYQGEHSMKVIEKHLPTIGTILSNDIFDADGMLIGQCELNTIIRQLKLV